MSGLFVFFSKVNLNNKKKKKKETSIQMNRPISINILKNTKEKNLKFGKQES